MMLRWWDKADWGPALRTRCGRTCRTRTRSFAARAAGSRCCWPAQLSRASRLRKHASRSHWRKPKKNRKTPLKTALEILLSKDSSEEMKLEAVRAVQLAFGDFTSKEAMGTVFEGYTFRKPRRRMWQIRFSTRSAR